MRRNARQALVALVAAAALTACAGNGSEGPSGDGSVDTSAELTLAQPGPVALFDPHQSRVPNGDPSYLDAVYDRLLKLDENLTLQPMLASEYSMNDDFTQLHIKLREDVVFQDGSKLDAEVVKANLERAQNLPTSTAVSLMAPVEGVETEGDYDVTINFSAPTPNFPYTLAQNYNLSAIVSGKALADGTDLNQSPAGSGPYEVVNIGADRVSFDRDDNYWDAENLPAVASYTLISMPDSGARVAALQSGQIDGSIFGNVDFELFESLVESGDFTQTDFGGSIAGIYLNSASPGLADPRVRRAIGLAIDRESISESLYEGIVPVAEQFFSKGTDGHVSDLDESHYDPAEAKRLLAEAGQTDLTIKAATTANTLNPILSSIYQDQLGKVGVELEITTVDSSELRSRWQAGDFDALVTNVEVRANPAFFAETNILGPYSPGEETPEMTEAAQEALLFGLDDPARVKAFEELSRLMDEEPVHIPVLQFNSSLVLRQGIGGADNMTFSQYAPLPDVRPITVTSGS
jgi:peptide/nickel transport system substrate-binding protein